MNGLFNCRMMLTDIAWTDGERFIQLSYDNDRYCKDRWKTGFFNCRMMLTDIARTDGEEFIQLSYDVDRYRIDRCRTVYSTVS